MLSGKNLRKTLLVIAASLVAYAGTCQTYGDKLSDRVGGEVISELGWWNAKWSNSNDVKVEIKYCWIYDGERHVDYVTVKSGTTYKSVLASRKNGVAKPDLEILEIKEKKD